MRFLLQINTVLFYKFVYVTLDWLNTIHFFFEIIQIQFVCIYATQHIYMHFIIGGDQQICRF